MLLRWIARSYEVDADYQAAEDCAIAAVATAELGDERNALGQRAVLLAKGVQVARHLARVASQLVEVSPELVELLDADAGDAAFVVVDMV